MDLRIPENRKKILEEIKTPENRDRKDASFIATEVYNGRLRQYVVEYLETLFSKSTVKEMPVQSGTNLARRIVSERASCYKTSPQRNFQNVDENQEEVLNKIYNDMKADFLLSKANEFYALQNQCLLQCVPIDGKLKLRVLKLHHFDVIPMPNNPEEMLGVVINSYDKRFKRELHEDNTPIPASNVSRPQRSDTSNGIDETIADPDDKGPETFEVWTRAYTDEKGEYVPALNFIMNKKGEMLSDDFLSPLEVLPFIDVCAYKDFQFFASDHNSVVNFTVEFNALMSEIAQGHRMQSYSQPFIKGPKELLPKSLDVGPNTILNLPTDPDLGDVEFGFAVPGGSVAHGIELAEQLLAQFLSCQGIDPKTVSADSGQRFSSGIERLLSMIERFDATRVDFNLFSEVEHKLFHLIHFWHNALQGTGTLDEKYEMPRLRDDVDIAVTFAKPEGAQTMLDKVAMHERLIEQGLGSRVTAIMDMMDMSRSEAEEYIQKIDEDDAGSFMSEQPGLPSPQISLTGLESEKSDSVPVESEIQVSEEEMIEKDVVLNGAQVTSMVGIVSSVANGELPRGTGISILMTAFGLTKEKAEEIMGESGRAFILSEQK